MSTKKSFILGLSIMFVLMLFSVQPSAEVNAATNYFGYDHLGQYLIYSDDYPEPIKIDVYAAQSYTSYQCLQVGEVPNIPARFDHTYGDVGDTISITETVSAESGYMLDLSFGVGMDVGFPMLAKAASSLTYTASRTWTTYLQEGTNVTFVIDEFADSGIYELQKCNKYRLMIFEVLTPIIVQEETTEWIWWPPHWETTPEVWGYPTTPETNSAFVAEEGTFYRVVKFSDLPY